MIIKKIISGGQTGADQAALDVAVEFGVPHGGWISKGRKTEKGRLPGEYQLKETTSIGTSQQTELNVVDSDGTLIISHGELTGGSALTQELAGKHRRPCLHIDLDEIDEPMAVQIINKWINAREIKTLNVAGPRASKDAEIYGATKRILMTVLSPPPTRILSHVPKTVEEAVEKLISELPLKDRTTIANMTHKELVKLHPTVGGYIRNQFGLSSDNKELMASCRFVAGKKDLNEDEASGIIIKKLWKRLHETHTLKVVK